jgi:hypothetical protein
LDSGGELSRKLRPTPGCDAKGEEKEEEELLRLCSFKLEIIRYL